MTSPRRLRDLALGAALLAVGVGEALLRDDLPWRPAAVLVAVVLAVAVRYRRDRPLATTVAAFCTLAALDVAAALTGSGPLTFLGGFGVLVFVYALPHWGSGRDVAMGLVVVAVAFAVAVTTDHTGLADAVGGGAVLVATGALGVAVRSRYAVRAQLVERARMHEREQLARELHDSVAHYVSGIAIQAQAGAFLARSGDADGAGEALDAIEGQAGRALAEMRTLVGDRRAGEATPRGLAGIEHLATGDAGPPNPSTPSRSGRRPSCSGSPADGRTPRSRRTCTSASARPSSTSPA